MDLLGLAFLTQADPATVVELDRIGDMLRLLAFAMAGIALMAVAIGGYSLYLLVSVRRVMRDAERKIRELTPIVTPTLNDARAVVAESARVVHGLHTRLDAVGSTVDDVNEALRDATRGAEVRLREFVAVLDVVREEAQELLLDTAATAHGVHTVATALRAPDRQRAVQPAPPPPIPDEVRRTTHGQG